MMEKEVERRVTSWTHFQTYCILFQWRSKLFWGQIGPGPPRPPGPNDIGLYYITSILNIPVDSKYIPHSGNKIHVLIIDDS